MHIPNPNQHLALKFLQPHRQVGKRTTWQTIILRCWAIKWFHQFYKKKTVMNMNNLKISLRLTKLILQIQASKTLNNEKCTCNVRTGFLNRSKIMYLNRKWSRLPQTKIVAVNLWINVSPTMPIQNMLNKVTIRTLTVLGINMVIILLFQNCQPQFILEMMDNKTWGKEQVSQASKHYQV